ncbi:orotate phosphoribosyltransferase [Myxococcota bacterium]|nr:orotate phosphoribosyltransferase [Myxococcota bacterium]MBU1380250.1 orotate phosphoribosyltransferase [Myxococcota bacterium]MBU1496364.1 orotate phosphoribosyltransferase [Myxococcota bacterium]
MDTSVRLLELLTELSYVKGEVTLASGKKSDFYIDCRKTILTAEGHWLTGSAFLEIIEEHFPEADAVGGVALGACPIASAVSLLSFTQGKKHLDAFYLRKEPKGHGMGKQLEGNIPAGTKCVIVEDVVTSGGSTLAALELAAKEGLDVAGVVVLVDRQEDSGIEKIRAKVPVVSIYTRQIIKSAGTGDE